MIYLYPNAKYHKKSETRISTVKASVYRTTRSNTLQFPDKLRWDTTNEAVVFDILCDYGSCSNGGTTADGNAGEDVNSRADPAVIPDRDSLGERTRITPLSVSRIDLVSIRADAHSGRNKHPISNTDVSTVVDRYSLKIN